MKFEKNLLLAALLSVSSQGFLRDFNKFHASSIQKLLPIFETIRVSPEEIGKKERVEKGCVLVANSDEYDRFMSKAVIFMINHGERGSQGLIVNKV